MRISLYGVLGAAVAGWNGYLLATQGAETINIVVMGLAVVVANSFTLKRG